MPLSDSDVLGIIGQAPPSQTGSGLTDAQVQAFLAPPQAPPSTATYRDIPGGQDTSHAVPEVSTWDRIKGAPGAALGMVTGAFAPIPAAIGAAGESVSNAARGVQSDFPSEYDRLKQFYTYTPATEGGREDVATVGRAIEGSKLAVPLPEFAFMGGSPNPLARTEAAVGSEPTLTGKTAALLSDTSNQIFPSVRVRAPLTPVPIQAAGQAVGAPSLASALSTPAAAGAAVPTVKVSGAMQKAAQVLMDQSGMDTPTLISTLRSGAADTPGSLPPTTGNLIGGNVAGMEKALRADADVQGILYGADADRTRAQVANISRFEGTPQQLSQDANGNLSGSFIDTRRQNAAPWTKILNDSNTTIDASPIVDAISQLRLSNSASNPTVSKALDSLSADLNRFNRAPKVPGIETNELSVTPGQLDGMRRNLRDTLAQVSPPGSRPTPEAVGLGPLQNAITGTIESQLPGYRSYLATYARDSQPINTALAAREFKGWANSRPWVNPDGTPSLTYQATQGKLSKYLEDESGVSPEFQQALQGMGNDMQRSTVVANANKQFGSDTIANLSARSKTSRLLQFGSQALPYGPQAYDVGNWVSRLASGPPGLSQKQALARMLADPQFAADVIGSMSPK